MNTDSLCPLYDCCKHKREERMISNYLFQLIDNTLLHTNSKCSPYSVLASRKLLEGLQLLVVAAATFAPAVWSFVKNDLYLCYITAM